MSFRPFYSQIYLYLALSKPMYSYIPLDRKFDFEQINIIYL